MKNKRLPKQVFVHYSEESNGDVYLEITDHPSEAIEDDGPTLVGTYELKEQHILAKEVKSKPAKQ